MSAGSEAGSDREPILRPGVTCWRLERAPRTALLVDAASYFRAARVAKANARRSILLLGWDFDPRVPLGPAVGPEGEAPRLCDLLAALLAERPELRIHVLIWDMALPYAIQRRDRPQRAGRWLPKERLVYRVDGAHPPGAAHHQKVLVVDDAVAFCGASDITRNRWDTPEHRPVDGRRRTLDGRVYGPRHEVMMAVDGPAAAALGDLARERWRRATGERLPRVAEAHDPWPRGLEADIEDATVGIARTEPAHGGAAEVREIEALHLRAIAAARRWIYLENQYLTSPVIGEALARSLARPQGPEIVFVGPVRSAGRFDHLLFDRARGLLLQRLRAADRHGRLRAFAALAAGGTPIIVHSKVTVVDDRLLRVGSANLANRSLGLDSECDLAIEATPGDERTRRGVRAQLVRLLAEHTGSARGRFAATLEGTGGLIATIDALNPPAGRRLAPLEVPRLGPLDRLIGGSHLFDPLGVADNWRPWRRLRRGWPRRAADG